MKIAPSARGAVLLSLLSLSLAAGLAVAAGPLMIWQEKFDKPTLGWIDPLKHSPAEIAQVYTIKHEGALSYLHARHDRVSSNQPPAIHYGQAFQSNPIPLEKIKALRWKWRVLQHPNIGKDPWEDLGAGVYVLIKQPTLFHAGKGFKFGWLARPSVPGHQRGLLEVPMRSDAASKEWKSESVDLCALFKQEYGAPCEGEKVLYVGVVTDADNTRSVSEGDYADFAIELNP